MGEESLQYHLWIKDLRKLEEMQKEEREKKNNKKLRAAFHLLSDLGKSMKEKTP